MYLLYSIFNGLQHFRTQREKVALKISLFPRLRFLTFLPITPCHAESYKMFVINYRDLSRIICIASFFSIHLTHYLLARERVMNSQWSCSIAAAINSLPGKIVADETQNETGFIFCSLSTFAISRQQFAYLGQLRLLLITGSSFNMFLMNDN